MSLKNYVNKQFLTQESPNYSKILFYLCFFSLIFLCFSTLWFTSLISVTNDLIQKENVFKKDQEFQNFTLNFTDFDEDLDYATYYRDLDIYVPKKMYVYFFISGLSYLFFLEFTLHVLIKYIRYKRGYKDENNALSRSKRNR